MVSKIIIHSINELHVTNVSFRHYVFLQGGFDGFTGTMGEVEGKV